MGAINAAVGGSSGTRYHYDGGLVLIDASKNWGAIPLGPGDLRLSYSQPAAREFEDFFMNHNFSSNL